MTSITRATAAAAALVEALPTPGRLTPSPNAHPLDVDTRSAISAVFVGEVSADVAIVILDDVAVAEAVTPTIAATDLLRPALEAATAELGTGVLGPARSGETSLFGDPDSSVFELRSEDRVSGWFAIRIHAGVPVRSDAVPIADRIGRIRNVEMTLTVELGRTRMPVRDVLGLEPGATIELDRSAGAPADVLLNGRLIALGEVVVVDQDYAVRITRILDTAEDGR